MIRHDGGRRPQGAAPSIVRSTITEHPRTSLFNGFNGLQDTTALFADHTPANEINDLRGTTADRRRRDSATILRNFLGNGGELLGSAG